MAGGRPWSKVEDDTIRRMYSEGSTQHKIALAINRSTESVSNRARALGVKKSELITQRIEAKFAPTVQRPIGELFRDQAQAYARKRARGEFKRDGFKVQTDGKPFGIAMFGDPHVGDDGTDIGRLCHDLEVCKGAEGVHAVNIGDLCNNWIGTLGRLYAHQHTTDDEEIEMARWLIHELPWALVILGNHDKWAHVAELLCKEAKVPYASHGARIEFLHPDGSSAVKVDARHHHRGNSMYNPSHGQLKKSYRGSDCEIIVGGHIHTGAATTVRNGETGILAHCIRLGAYKDEDEHADAQGFSRDSVGPSCMAAVNTRAKTEEGKIQVFWDLAEGAEYVSWLRSR